MSVSMLPISSLIFHICSLRAAKVQSTAFEQFDDNKRMTEWIIPSAQTIGQYVRIQLQNRNFLHVAEVEVFGVYSAFNYVGRVGTAQCGDQATLVIIPPTPHSTVLDDYYLRAIQADADNATILRQYEAYESSYRKFGRGTRDELGRKCCLCRVFRECELCTFLKNSPSIYDKNGELPKRIVGDRLGLKVCYIYGFTDFILTRIFIGPRPLSYSR